MAEHAIQPIAVVLICVAVGVGCLALRLLLACLLPGNHPVNDLLDGPDLDIRSKDGAHEGNLSTGAWDGIGGPGTRSGRDGPGIGPEIAGVASDFRLSASSCDAGD